MLMKFFAAVGIAALFVLISVIFAAIMASVDDRWESDPEEDEEQAAYLREWEKRRQNRRGQ